VVNAIGDALGVSFNFVPLLPEDIFHSLHEKALQDNALHPVRGER